MSKLSDKTHLKQKARDDAYTRMWYDIYRHKMRYCVEDVAEALDLDDVDIREIKTFYKQDEASQLPVRFVTINLPDDYDLDIAVSALKNRILTKCYVGDWAYAFELGGDSGHPHYHVYFISKVKWLAKSRIIQEWSKVFKIDPQYIDVKETNESQIPRIDSYIHKEDIHYESSNTKKSQKMKK